MMPTDWSKIVVTLIAYFVACDCQFFYQSYPFEYFSNVRTEHVAGLESRVEKPPEYLDSFFPAAMQLLHYFSERMSYTELQTTTVAPPYTGGDYESGQQVAQDPISHPPPTATRPPAPITSRPPAPIASRPPSGHPPAATLPPWSSAATSPTTTTTTARPPTTAWPTTTTASPIESTTQFHGPGIFAPVPPQYQMQRDPQVAYRPPPHATIQQPPRPQLPPWPVPTKRPGKPNTSANNDQFFSWLFQSKPKAVRGKKDSYKYELLDPLPQSLLDIIENETFELPAQRDEDNVREFLKKYDDQYGKYVPSQTGNKRMPPTKPYVEFIVLYDLMKREAKMKMLNNFVGYSDAVLNALISTSHYSSERQLHFVLSQMIARNEADSNGIKIRVASLLKDLENPHTVTSQTLRVIPSFEFAP